jgi:hypothetical protein
VLNTHRHFGTDEITPRLLYDMMVAINQRHTLIDNHKLHFYVPVRRSLASLVVLPRGDIVRIKCDPDSASFGKQKSLGERARGCLRKSESDGGECVSRRLVIIKVGILIPWVILVSILYVEYEP